MQTSDRHFVHVAWRQVRSTMLWSLSTCLQVWLQGDRPFLSKDEQQESSALLELHLISYQYLASESLKSQRLGYYVRPKFHYCAHLLEWLKERGANPQAFSCFMDEDHMKALRGIVTSLHPTTSIMKLAPRYMLKRLVSFDKTDGGQHKKARRCEG